MNSLARGLIDNNITVILRSLERPIIAPPLERRALYATNFKVWKHNTEALHAMDGEAVSYTAEDEGDQKELSSLPVDKVWKALGYCKLKVPVNYKHYPSVTQSMHLPQNLAREIQSDGHLACLY